jgi:hypothetical protein
MAADTPGVKVVNTLLESEIPRKEMIAFSIARKHSVNARRDDCAGAQIRIQRRLAWDGVTFDSFAKISSGRTMPAAAVFSST